MSRLGHGDRGCRWSLSSIASLSFALMLPAALLAPHMAQAAKPGDLDRSFGGDGIATTAIRGGVSGRSVAVDSQDRIVVAAVRTPPSPPARRTSFSSGTTGTEASTVRSATTAG